MTTDSRKQSKVTINRHLIDIRERYTVFRNARICLPINLKHAFRGKLSCAYKKKKKNTHRLPIRYANFYHKICEYTTNDHVYSTIHEISICSSQYTHSLKIERRTGSKRASQGHSRSVPLRNSEVEAASTLGDRSYAN